MVAKSVARDPREWNTSSQGGQAGLFDDSLPARSRGGKRGQHQGTWSAATEPSVL